MSVLIFHGTEEVVPASEMIHLYRREFPNQVRGIPPFNGVLLDLKQLDDYRTSELLAAKAGACLGVFYERNSMTNSGDFLDRASGSPEEDDPGVFVQTLEPGVASVAPEGYNVKTLAPNHPQSGFEQFNKAVLKQVASSLGTSYNKMIKDYESASYSALKEASIDESGFYQEFQQYLIENWKEVEYREFLKAQGISDDELRKCMRFHTWICQRRPYVDRAKEIVGEKYSLEMGVKNPIELIESEGKDVDEVLKGWQLWKDLCLQYGVNFNIQPAGQQEPLLPVEEKTDEEILNEQR